MWYAEFYRGFDNLGVLHGVLNIRSLHILSGFCNELMETGSIDSYRICYTSLDIETFERQNVESIESGKALFEGRTI